MNVNFQCTIPSCVEWRALAAVGEHIPLTKHYVYIVEQKETCKVVIYLSCLGNLVCSPSLFLLILLYLLNMKSLKLGASFMA